MDFSDALPSSSSSAAAARRPRRRVIAVLMAAATCAALIGLTLTATVSGAGMITQTTGSSFTVGLGEPGYPNVSDFKMDVSAGSQVVTLVVRVPSGGSFGWHSHTAPLTVTVIQGTLMLYAPPTGYVEGTTPSAASCDHKAYEAGTGFLEEPGVIHLARNESRGLAVISVTYLGIAPGTSGDVYEDGGYQPCTGIY